MKIITLSLILIINNCFGQTYQSEYSGVYKSKANSITNSKNEIQRFLICCCRSLAYRRRKRGRFRIQSDNINEPSDSLRALSIQGFAEKRDDDRVRGLTRHDYEVGG